ncbi:MAG: hypothetical protein AAF773_00815 [Cyanobacteria bacterium P01_D01_bin.115]
MNKAELMSLTLDFPKLLATLIWCIAEEGSHEIPDDIAPLIFALMLGLRV